jgi:hypothetical protein
MRGRRHAGAEQQPEALVAAVGAVALAAPRRLAYGGLLPDLRGAGTCSATSMPRQPLNTP